ncbi:Peptidase U32 [Pleodorina starrii]|nr:Peptidase U32 [Pleodorina starrii]
MIATISVGYSAGDAPEKRKNPELYAGLKDTPTGSERPQQPHDALAAGPAPAHRHPAAVTSPDGPAVSYMLSPATATPTATPASAAFRTPDAAPRLDGAGGLVPLAHKPEVLAPVGGWPQLRAAVENGADAVYFGLDDFNARARAANFSLEELPDVMSYLHARGVKGFVALNVLVFDEELAAVEARVRAMAEAGVDAVIVQDWGVVELMRRVAPGLPVHGSTQMSITSAEGAAWVSELGVERVVVGRELSVREIAKVRDGVPGTEVEAFVHGALCVSYSGQCFSSEAWGGRSANRGQCAQACRLPYGLLVDGVIRELGDVRYLLSPQDLMAVEQVPELIRAGVSCFKIEGRLKGPEYVALTTQVYRRAVDAAWEELTAPHTRTRTAAGARAAETEADVGGGSSGGGDAAAAAARAVALTEQQRWDLEQVFARGQDGAHRGLTPGFLEGVRHQRLVRGRAPRHRGVFLGRVESVSGRGVAVELQAPLKRGDGVAFDCGEPEQDEPGGVVYDILPDAKGSGGSGAASGGGGSNAPVPPGSRVTLVLGQGVGQAEILRRVAPGDLVWRTKDPALESRLRASYDGLAAADARSLPVAAAVRGGLGSPLTLTLTDPVAGVAVSASTRLPLAAASKRPLSAEDVARALGSQLGEATLALAVEGDVDVSGLELEAGLFIPASELKAVRRQAVEALLAARRQYDSRRADGLAEGPVLPNLLAAARAAPAPAPVLRLLSDLSSTTTAAEAMTEEAAGDGGAVHDGGQDRVASGAAAGPSGRGGGTAAAAGGGKRGGGGGGSAAAGGDVCIRVLCRSREQVDAALAVPWLREVVVDFLEVLGLKEAVAAIRASGRRVVVATPRVLKPDEQRLWLFYLRLGADALLVRSAGMLHQLQALGGPGAVVPDVPYPIPALEGDFSLNVANVLSAALLLRGGTQQQPHPAAAPAAAATAAGPTVAAEGEVLPEGGGDASVAAGGPWRGLSRLAPTHDLHAAQMAALAGGLGPRAAQLEAIVHQHLPIFHTEHCVFCRFLSSGNSYKDCGHPCETHRLHLRDETGADHLVLADMGCRNTVFNAKAQSGVFYLRDLIRAGFRTVRIELVDEQPQYVAPLLEGYRDVILGRRGPGDLWRWLGTLPDANGAVHGVDAGSLQVHKERSRGAMKPTAAALKQQQQQQQQQQQAGPGGGALLAASGGRRQ